MVIDFEYAGANMPGLEFANHFIEWTYNYHDPVMPHQCNSERYPKTEEQHRFIKAYIDHRPGNPNTPRLAPIDSASNTPSLGASTATSSINDFMLDARAPPGGWSAAERAKEEATDRVVAELIEEVRLWRPANSAFWISWGIVQAKVPGLNMEEETGPEDEEAEAEFDYLSYAQDRALFFWGDIVQMGLVKVEELPLQLRSRLKIVDH